MLAGAASASDPHPESPLTIRAAFRAFTLFGIYGAIVLSASEGIGAYVGQTKRGASVASLASVLKASCFAYAAVLVLSFLLDLQPLLSPVLGTSVLAGVFLMSGLRVWTGVRSGRGHIREALQRNVLVLGTKHTCLALQEHLAQHPELHLQVAASVDAAERFDPENVADLREWLLSSAHTHFADEVMLCGLNSELCETAIVIARQIGLPVRVVPDLFGNDRVLPVTEFVGAVPTFVSHRKPMNLAGVLAKRALDLLCAGFALIVLLPLFLTLMLLIKLDSPGPILYRSQRVGRKGRTFWCLKFRTMVVNAEQLKETLKHLNERDGILFKIANDPRITRLGRYLRKYSLDELPQFLNVLKGDMSLVGPRPPLANEVAQYEGEQRLRLAVNPGITGLWQVEARANPSFERYMELDLQYVREWNLKLDLRILLRTVRVVFAGTGH
jgi:exopolysaccharide biosynthesis polyprenyl glycosylphosphotransferase